MSIFTEHPISAPTEIYASTNRYMRRAIVNAEQTLTGFLTPSAAYTAMTGFLNSFPSVDWLEVDYKPMSQVTRQWINTFFEHKSERGLYPLEQQWTPRRIWNGTSGSWEYWLNPSDNDLRLFAAPSTWDCSSIGMLGRIREFLDWTSDPLIVGKCQDWADAFLEVNSDANVYGHRRGVAAWTLYNLVHVGPPAGAVASSADDFETKLRWAFEGLPDSSWAQTLHYGVVATALERLSIASQNTTYATIARTITNKLWNARLDQSRYFLCDTVTPWGLIPGDFDESELKYMYDTDSLYWSNALYEAYRVSGGQWSPQLAVAPNAQSFDENVDQRRSLVEGLLSSTAPDDPIRYLAIALATTLEWMRYGWLKAPGNNHFVRKIHHDGTLVQPHTLYGDALYNTFRMLLNAYRSTHDSFYLMPFKRMLYQHRKVTYGEPEILDPAPPNIDTQSKYFFHGLLPEVLVDGALGEPKETRRSQDGALDLVVRAYAASQEAGAPDATLLAAATEMADRIMQLDDQGYGPVLYSGHNDLLHGALLCLARRPGTLRRIGFNLQTTGRTVVFEGAAIEPLTLVVPQGRAVVYMDDGEYQISGDGPAAATVAYYVVADAINAALPF